MLLTKTIKSRATQKESELPSRTLVHCNLYPVVSRLISVWSFLILHILFQLQNVGTPRSVVNFTHCPSLFQRQRWVSLWTHTSTVTRSTSRLSTGERWECVEVKTVCCCWLYWYTGMTCGIPPLPKQLAHCGLHHHKAATNHTVTLVHQLHPTINLQSTVEPQYCTTVYKFIIKWNWKHSTASSWNTPSVFVLQVVSEIWFQSEVLFLALCTHGHCVSDCSIKMCGRKRKFDLSCRGLRTDCSTADCILIQKYLLL
jgi:hypothetical protein